MVLRSKDLIPIFGCSPENAKQHFIAIKKKLGLKREHYLSIGKFCEATKLPIEEVEEKLGWNKTKK